MIGKSVKKGCLSVFGAFLAFGLSLSAYGFEIEIDVAPNVLNIESQGTVVTVHTDIAYGSVDVSSVFLNGVEISSWKADNRGNFVAKFLMDEIKTLDGLAIGDYNVLVLVGYTKDYEEFVGVTEILVVNNVPKGKR